MRWTTAFFGDLLVVVIVWGLGHCGLVNAACLADMGHTVIGLDIDPARVAAVNAGRCDVCEPGLADLLRRGVRSGRIRASAFEPELVETAAASLICVETPALAGGTLDPSRVLSVVETIGSACATRSVDHCIIVRSTTTVGFLRAAKTALEQAGLDTLATRNLTTVPEFLREGRAVEDFLEPSLTVVGAFDPSGVATVADLFSELSAPIVSVAPELAEALKLVNNAFHALKIGFANEVGRLCAVLGVDGAGVMDLLCRDLKLNLSPTYLQPGAPFGGPCLTKDLTALLRHGAARGVSMPLVSAVASGNARHIDELVQIIERHRAQRIGFLGLTFKAGTDDLRNSVALMIAARLVRDGRRVVAYDKTLKVDDVSARNRALLAEAIGPETGLLVATMEAVLAHSELVVIAHPDSDFRAFAHAHAHAGRGIAILDICDPSSVHDHAGV